MDLEFSGEIIHWRGPAPFLFVPLPPDPREAVREVRREATYGWGVIPVTARIGETTFTTSLFPRDGGYLLPVKVAVQRAEGIGLGDEVSVRMAIDLG
ncbi:DUF1905 domain-containing protein [Georgenia sp. Z1344]|uniref:DUF1905 domain-containing protein n=1 Tax=Georgenia sp. Z1344 TaxID=3416706 RepID=UPI003CEE4A40